MNFDAVILSGMFAAMCVVIGGISAIEGSRGNAAIAGFALAATILSGVASAVLFSAHIASLITTVMGGA